ncbi:MAG: cytochrome c biogenesis protein CcdA, partial [Gammaproteobacteria bacterium]
QLSVVVDPSIARITYQGCSAEGFCYPPVSKAIQGLQITACDSERDETCLVSSRIPNASDESAQFFPKSIWFTLASFLGLGILLGFTPCVFPMIPILMSILVGNANKISQRHTFKLGAVYVLSMAMTYAIAGMLAGWLGSYVQAFFQKPWVLITASGILILLAFSLFGFYELQLPAVLRQWLAKYSHRQRGGTYLGVILMGCLATLIVSPCVSPPLVAALGYISTTGNMYLGGAALFMLGFGLGLPLLILIAVGSRYLPKAGRWMKAIKALSGGLLLVVAVLLLVRVFPSSVSSELPFKPVKNIVSVEKELKDAKQQGKSVLVDFYADWCISCKKLEKYTFQDPRVLPVLKTFVLLRIDVTANDADDKAMLKRFNTIAPPTLLLFDAKGKEYRRIVGE